MDYLPPVVVEHVVASDLDAAWKIPRLRFRREKDGVGLDYDYESGVLIGARYGDTAHMGTGPVHDSRWTLKITLRL
jgi:hypothetical protein